MDIREIKENKLKTILQFSVPSIIAMLLQTAITITDGCDRRGDLHTHIRRSVPVIFPNSEGAESGWRIVRFLHTVLPYYAVHLSPDGCWYDTGNVSPCGRKTSDLYAGRHS